ncbi:MAG: energy transducer TonB [Acidobacteriota bacterium]
MFETVVPETVARPSRRLFYETLPVSLAVHAVAVGGILLSSIWDVAFPSQSPRITLGYSLTRLPDPPPPPPPPPAAQPAALVKPQVLPKPTPPPPAIAAIVAPTVIPDLIPPTDEAPPAPPAAVEAPMVVEAAPHAAAGDAKGVLGGDLLGKKFGVPGGIVFAEDGKVHVDRHEKLPLKILEQEFPVYPQEAKRERLEDACVIRYTIGLNGRVIDLAVIEHAKHEMFETVSLDVIRRWRFRPMKVNGQAVEVVHEVEFFYQFTQR